MTRRPRAWTPPVRGMVSALLIAACTGGAQPTSGPTGAPVVPTVGPTAGGTPSEESAPPGTDAPPTGTAAYPEEPADCEAEGYTGEFKQIVAVDAMTVRFDLCFPDVAFLSKIAFSAFAIDDSAYLAAHMPDGSILGHPNGTGPYMLDEWSRGNRMSLVAYDGYWGEEKALTPNLEFRWSAQAAQRLLELQAGTVHCIDNPGTDDFETIAADPNLAFYERPGLNTFYLGFNNTVEPFDDVNVRKAIALGIDRTRLVDSFYPPGSEVATHFTPCDIPFGCEGDPWFDFDPAAAKQLLVDAGFPDGFTTKIQFRDAVRGYLPDPPTIAQELQAQLEQNLGITAELELMDSGAFLDANAAGTLDGIFLLGWGADYPDATNFLDYHFGAGSGVKFGEPFQDIVDALSAAGQTPVEEERASNYATANDLIKEHVPMALMAHGGSGTVFRADVTGAHSSPLSTEIFSVMDVPDGEILVWMQNAEPLSLYCGDESDGETLRACEQVKESLYAYTIGGVDVVPSLATECTPSEALDSWTCTLREGVTFHDGSTFEASDVIDSYALMWDAENPLHKGRSGAFEYFPGLFGGFLNPPPPAE